MEIAATLAGTGCEIVDGAIVGAPPQPGEKGPRIYVSGDRSDRASVLSVLICGKSMVRSELLPL